MTQPIPPTDVDLVARAIAWKGLFDEEQYAGWELDRQREAFKRRAAAALDALAHAGRLPEAAEVIWQYAVPDPDEPDGLLPLDGTPKWISPRLLRRPLAPVGPWAPAPSPSTEETPRNDTA